MSSPRPARAPNLAVGILLPVLLGLPAGLTAQISSDHGPLILELPASTAAQAMGNAPNLSEGPAAALFYNPAVLDRARGVEGAVHRYGARATLLDLAAAADWWGGGAGLAIRALSFEGPDGAADRPTESEAALHGAGPEGISEVAASAGYGRRFGGVSLGAAVTFLERRAGGERDAGAAAALGAAVGAGPLTVGLAVRNLGPALEMGGGELPLPHRVELAASSRDLQVGPLDLGATGSVSRLADGELIPALGVRLAYWPVVGRTFILRGGVRRIPRGPADEISLGAAFRGDEIVLEYAYQGFDGLDGAHRFGIGWR